MKQEKKIESPKLAKRIRFGKMDFMLLSYELFTLCQGVILGIHF